MDYHSVKPCAAITDKNMAVIMLLHVHPWCIRHIVRMHILGCILYAILVVSLFGNHLATFYRVSGGAKPVDTASREREIEEKLQKQQQPPASSLRSRDNRDRDGRDRDGRDSGFSSRDIRTNVERRVRHCAIPVTPGSLTDSEFEKTRD